MAQRHGTPVRGIAAMGYNTAMRRSKFVDHGEDFEFPSRFWYVLIVLAMAAGIWIFTKTHFPQETWDALESTYMQDGTEEQSE